MLFRRIGALFAAFAIGLIPLASQAADQSAAPAPSLLTQSGGQLDAQQQSDLLKDIPPNSWAYQAIVQLVNDGIIIGYPDGTFKGQRPMTRYEAAVMTERAVARLSVLLANAQTAIKVNSADIAALRNLLDEFKGDIDSLKIKVADLQDQTNAINTRLKTVEATQDRAQIHAVYYIRPGSFDDQVSAYTSDGRALAANVGLAPVGSQTQVGAGGAVSSPRYLTGNNSTGYGYQLIRLLLDGNLDPKTSYHIRVENVYNWDTADAFQAGALNGTTTVGGVAESSPNVGAPSALLPAGVTVNGLTYPRNTGIRFNYGYVQYLDKTTGLQVEAGRINETDGTLGLGWSDQFNGAEIGYVKGPINVRGGYAFMYPGLNQFNGSCKAINQAAPLGGGANGSIGALPCGITSQTVFATASYKVMPPLTVGVAYMDDISAVVSSWNPSVCYNGAPTCSAAALATPGVCAVGATTCNPVGLYQNTVTNIAVGSIFGTWQNPDQFGKGLGLSFEAEGLTRFGNDPWTHIGWTEAQSLWLQGKFGGYNAVQNTAYIEAGYMQNGLNSNNSHTNVSGAIPYENQFLGNANGYRIGYVGAHYWFSKYGRVGLIYNAYDLIPGTTYPVGTATCPGCFLTHDIGQAVFLQTYLQF